jgi:hypothetical protein
MSLSFISSGHSQGASQVTIKPISAFAGSTVDAYGRTVFMVSPGQTVSFTAIASANPKQMFAGSYVASVNSVYGDPIPPTTDGASVFANVSASQSNPVTIIGEVSPYISSVTPNIVSSGQTITLSGQRLGVRDAVSIDNNSVRLNIGGGQTSLSFIVPSLTNGYHSVQITDAVTGASNQVSFQVQASSPTSCYVFSTNLTIGSTGVDVVALQTWLMGNGFDIPALSQSRTQRGYYGATTATAVAKYQASVGIPATGYFGPATRAALNGSCTPATPVPPISVCPAGYTCVYTPGTPAQGNCPAGYVCTINTSAQPYITSITPTAGGLNTTVTINGSGFASNDTVEFDQNGQAMGGISGPSLSSVTSNQIVFTLGSLTVSNIQSGVYQIKVTPNYSVTSAGSNPVSFTLAGTCTYNCGTPITTQPPLTQYTSSDQLVTFSKNFYVSQTGSPVTLAIAADNSFSVSVNGTVVSTNNSETNFYSSQSIDLTSAVRQGNNALAITVDNMVNPATTGTAWASNPAGLDYKITSNGSTLASSDGSEQSSVSSAIVIPQNKILYSWTSIPGANWIWDSSYYNAAQSVVSSCPTGYNCSTNQPSITVTYPQTGYSLDNGHKANIATITWTTQNFGNLQVQISLVDLSGRVIKTVAQNVPNTGSYVWANDPSIPDGQYEILLSSFDKGPSAQSYSGYFTLTGNSSTSQPPVISGGTFPTTLNVGQTGTWTVNAYDPSNGSLSYSVNWGDTSPCNLGATMCPASVASTAFVQSSSFTHSYSSAGTYTSTFTVKNASGLTAQTTSTVQVGNSPTNAPLSISSISPTSGYAATSASSPGPTLTIYGSGFSQGDTVSLFIATPSGGNVNIKTATPTSVSPTQMTVSFPPFNSGNYSVQVSYGGQNSNTIPYAINLQSPPPASFSTIQSETPGYQGSDTYSNPRFYTSGWSGELKPANDAASATAWCKAVSGKSYTSGSFSSAPSSNEDDYKYDFNGSQWTRMIQGEYAGYYTCSGEIPTPITPTNPVVSNTSATLGAAVTSQSGTTTEQFTFAFTLTAGNSPIYVSSTASLVQSTASNNFGMNYTNVSADPGSLVGDGSGYFMIPPGSSRSFTLNGAIVGMTGAAGSVQINQIYYGTSSSNLQSNSISQGLGNLTISPVFSISQTSLTGAIWNAVQQYLNSQH